MCVCVCACARACVCIFSIVMLEPLLMSTLWVFSFFPILITFSISMHIICVILYLLSTLSHRACFINFPYYYYFLFLFF